jgi:hypothetical protein
MPTTTATSRRTTQGFTTSNVVPKRSPEIRFKSPEKKTCYAVFFHDPFFNPVSNNTPNAEGQKMMP